jgi:hypothetical protein
MCWTGAPFPLSVPGMILVPYSVENNDGILFLGKGLSGPEFVRTVKGQFDRLYLEGVTSARVMALCLHPFIINQPFRPRYLEEVLAYIASHEDVWLTTADEVADHYVSAA